MKQNRSLVIAHEGARTHLFVDGKLYGDGITKIVFVHKGYHKGRKPYVELSITVDDVVIEGESGREDAFMQMVEGIVRGERVDTLKDYTKIVVETDEENPVTIAEITSGEIKAANGYRVRLTPKYD